MSIQSEIDRIKAAKADAKAALIERGVDPGDATIDEYGDQIRAIPTGVTSFNGRTGAVEPQAGDYTAEMVGAIDQNEKGRASGVASLDADGKVPAGELPEMNYDPAGSAQAVQQELNTHAANHTFHVTDAERQAWNNKAAGTHTHTAAQVGALPISGGTLTGALNMNGKALTNLPTPKNNKDAVPKDYVDAAFLGRFVSGTYVGSVDYADQNGVANTQHINLGGKPYFVAVCSTRANYSGRDDSFVLSGDFATRVSGRKLSDGNRNTEYVLLALDDTGFTVGYARYATGQDGSLASKGITYSYFAFMK